MPKSDFIPRTDSDFLVWHDQFKTSVLAQAVADKNTSRANANKHARVLAARIKAHPAYTVALGSLLGIEGPQDTTDLTTSKPTLAGVDQTGGVVELDFDKSISDGVPPCGI